MDGESDFSQEFSLNGDGEGSLLAQNPRGDDMLESKGDDSRETIIFCAGLLACERHCKGW